MKVREIFTIGNISESINRQVPYLDQGNCEIVNVSKDKKAITLHLRRESDGEEGKARLRTQTQFESIADQLLNRIFVNNSILGLTLNQLADFETNLSIEKHQGRFTVR